MKYIKTLLLLILIFINFDCLANQDSNLTQVKVFHINGVNTSMRQAYDNLDALMEATNIKSNFLDWDLVYNLTSGSLMKDLEDTFRMKFQEGEELTLDDFVKTYMKSHNLNFPKGSDKYKNLKDTIKEKYAEDTSFVGVNFKIILRQFKKRLQLPFTEMVKKYKEDGKNFYVLLLPHSQGNQYANLLWGFVKRSNLFPINNLKIYGIALPTNTAKGSDGNYMTATNDLVINGLRNFAENTGSMKLPLPGNITLNCSKLGTCHSLITARRIFNSR